MKKTFLYGAKISRRTEANALAWLNTCRGLYNLALGQRITAWKNCRRSVSGCGGKVEQSLSVRTHRCPHCGLTLDRDENAAINIKALGQRVQALTLEISRVARESCLLQGGGSVKTIDTHILEYNICLPDC